MPTPDPGRAVSRRELRALVQLALRSLPPAQSLTLETLWLDARELWLDLEKFRDATDWPYLVKALAASSARLRELHIYCNWELARAPTEPGGAVNVPASKPLPFWQDAALRNALVAAAAQTAASSELRVFEWAGVPLREPALLALVRGLAKNHSLENLSFARSRIGDAVFRHLAPCLRQMPRLAYLNLGGCDLLHSSVELLAELVRRQSLQHASSAWERSLRIYRSLDDARTSKEAALARHSLRGTVHAADELDWGVAVRRLVLSGNPQIGDAGVAALAGTLGEEDVGLRALDVQACGLTASGGIALLDALAANQTLIVVDPRANPRLPAELQRRIVEQAQLNAVAFPPHASSRAYTWADAPTRQDPRVLRESYHYLFQLRRRVASTRAPLKQRTDETHTHLFPAISISAGHTGNPRARDQATSPTRLVLAAATAPAAARTADRLQSDHDLLALMETALKQVSALVEKCEADPVSRGISPPAILEQSPPAPAEPPAAQVETSPASKPRGRRSRRPRRGRSKSAQSGLAGAALPALPAKTYSSDEQLLQAAEEAVRGGRPLADPLFDAMERATRDLEADFSFESLLLS